MAFSVIVILDHPGTARQDILPVPDFDLKGCRAAYAGLVDRK